MFVEPDGPGYEIDILGHVTSAAAAGPGTLHSNKHTLMWPGVALGDAK